jgi:hypothetical protein
MPRIELIGDTATDAEAAAIVAALEQFLADTAPPPAPEGRRVSAWQRAALEEGVSARRLSAAAWGHAPARHTQTG